jgi:MFS family permease
MDTGIIGGVLTMPDFATYVHWSCSLCIPNPQADNRHREFGLVGPNKINSANLSADLVTTMQAGAFAGALLAVPMAEMRGRKPGLLLVSVFAFVGGLLQAFSYGHLACFYVGRFVKCFSD